MWWWFTWALAQQGPPVPPAPPVAPGSPAATEEAPEEEAAGEEAPEAEAPEEAPEGEEPAPSEAPPASDIEQAEEAGPTGSDEEPAEAPTAPPVIEIPPFELNTGLQGFEDEARTYAEAGEQDALPRAVDWGGPPVMMRGRWYVRPLLSWAQLRAPTRNAASMRLGVATGRQWFTAGSGTVQWGAAADFRLSAPVGGATGYRLHGAFTGGPWLGPVGLRVGPAARVERSEWGSATLLLDPAALVGAKATLALDLGKLRPYVEVEPNWVVSGTRASASPVTAKLPVVGTETTWGAGLGLQTGWFAWTAHGSWRETGIGHMLDVGLGVHVRPGG